MNAGQSNDSIQAMIEALRKLGYTVVPPAPDYLQCTICGMPAVWGRQTQFSGIHLYCQEHAELEPDFRTKEQGFWVDLAEEEAEAYRKMFRLLQGKTFVDRDELLNSIEQVSHSSISKRALPLNYISSALRWAENQGLLQNTDEGSLVVRAPR